MQENEIFKKFILKQIAGEVVYSIERHSFQLSLRSVSSTIHEAILAEGHKWGMTDDAIEDFVNTTIKTAELAYKPHKQPAQFVDVAQDLGLGQVLWLEGKEDGHGVARLQLFYLGVSEVTNHSQFLVLSSTRVGLQPEDVVEPADNTLWSVGYPIFFSVYRRGIRYPDVARVYRTYMIENIIKVMPSVVHEIIDARNEFSFLEFSANKQDKSIGNSLSFGRNAMSLLFHEYSFSMPIYVNFDEQGLGEFSSTKETVFAPSEVRDSLFGIVNDTQRQHSLIIETEKPGQLYLDSDQLKLRLKEPAQAKVKMSKK